MYLRESKRAKVRKCKGELDKKCGEESDNTENDTNKYCKTVFVYCMTKNNNPTCN